LFNEERGTLEKFRPYALPPEPWLAEVRQHLGAKSATSPSIGVLGRAGQLLRGRRPTESE
jgi:hypothetical protein